MSVRKIQLTAALFILFGCLGAWSDTIYFKDGTTLDCIVNEEKKVWKDIDDPNFYEIEVYGGYVGFWDEGQVERIEKNDNYTPPTGDTLQYMKELIEENRLILPTQIMESGTLFTGEVEKPIAGEILQAQNFAYIEDTGLENKLPISADQQFRSDQMLSTAPNSRLKFEIGPMLTGGLAGQSTLSVKRLNHADHLLTYEISLALEQGQMWVQVRPYQIGEGVSEKLTLQLRDARATITDALLHCELVPEAEQFRISLLRGEPLNFRVQETPSTTELRQGQALIIPTEGEKILEVEDATPSLVQVWDQWDSWQPVQVDIPSELLIEEPLPAPLAEELSAFTGGITGRGVTLGFDPATTPLPIILRQYREALERFKERNGEYPAPEDWVEQLREQEPIQLRNLPEVDPWGNPFILEMVAAPPRVEDVSQVVVIRSIGPNSVDEKGLGDDIQ
jgi:hypothetical protein